MFSTIMGISERSREVYNHYHHNMRTIILIVCFLGLALALRDNTCPESKQVRCADDIRAAYPVCQKAAQEGGSDIVADLNCIKYFNTMKADCWPCICWVAEQDHVQVKGC